MLKNFVIITLVWIIYGVSCFGQVTGISYPASNTFKINTPITPLTPTITGSGVAIYTIKPKLPDDLKFDPATGVISGTPNVASSTIGYTVNSDKGITSKSFNITVISAAPSITYTSENTFIVGSAITALKPISVSGLPTMFYISPTLPAGFNFDTTTGEIKGTPNSVSSADYTIVAYNEAGVSLPAKLKITVNPKKDCGSDITIYSLVGVFILCLIIIYFLLVEPLKSQAKNEKTALGFPNGSVRAIIAILFLVFFMLLAIIFYFDSSNTHSPDLAKQILTILGTLVTAVSAFYFGSKATEQGHQIATEAFQNANKDASDIPVSIVQEAIQNNKASWITKYNCKDIIAGKKTSQTIIQNLNCIVFIAESKVNSPGTTSIPETISYNSKGTVYDIPTDVQVNDTNESINLDINKMSDSDLDTLMRSAIKENYDLWKIKYPNIIGCTVGIKKTNGLLVAQKAIIFKVNGKQSSENLASTAIIPSIISYKNLQLPTDVVDTALITSLTNIKEPGNYIPARIGTSLSRDNSSDFGTVSLRVKVKDINGDYNYHVLSCFHVLFPDKLSPSLFDPSFQQNITLPISDRSNLVTIPSKAYLSTNQADSVMLQSYAQAGVMAPMMDAAISLITNGELDQKCFDQTIISGEANVDDLAVGTMLYSYGCVTGKLNGTISDLSTSRTDVIFSNNLLSFSYTFNDLIEMAVPCQPGDSGAPVLTQDGRIVGIITSGNGTHSYFIPFANIKNTLSFEL